MAATRAWSSWGHAPATLLRWPSSNGSISSRPNHPPLNPKKKARRRLRNRTNRQNRDDRIFPRREIACEGGRATVRLLLSEKLKEIRGSPWFVRPEQRITYLIFPSPFMSTWHPTCCRTCPDMDLFVPLGQTPLPNPSGVPAATLTPIGWLIVSPRGVSRRNTRDL